MVSLQTVFRLLSLAHTRLMHFLKMFIFFSQIGYSCITTWPLLKFSPFIFIIMGLLPLLCLPNTFHCCFSYVCCIFFILFLLVINYSTILCSDSAAFSLQSSFQSSFLQVCHLSLYTTCFLFIFDLFPQIPWKIVIAVTHCPLIHLKIYILKFV